LVHDQKTTALQIKADREGEITDEPPVAAGRQQLDRALCFAGNPRFPIGLVWSEPLHLGVIETTEGVDLPPDLRDRLNLQ